VDAIFGVAVGVGVRVGVNVTVGVKVGGEIVDVGGGTVFVGAMAADMHPLTKTASTEMTRKPNPLIFFMTQSPLAWIMLDAFVIGCWQAETKCLK
jgi:hypothetical protein